MNIFVISDEIWELTAQGSLNSRCLSRGDLGMIGDRSRCLSHGMQVVNPNPVPQCREITPPTPA